MCDRVTAMHCRLCRIITVIFMGEPAGHTHGAPQQRRCRTPLRKRLISLPACHYGSQSCHFVVRIFSSGSLQSSLTMERNITSLESCWWPHFVCDPSPLRRETATNAVICNSAHQSSHSRWSRNNSYTHCDLWDVLFSLIRHFSFDSTFSNQALENGIPSWTDAAAALAWMGASGNGRPSVSAM